MREHSRKIHGHLMSIALNVFAHHTPTIRYHSSCRAKQKRSCFNRAQMSSAFLASESEQLRRGNTATRASDSSGRLGLGFSKDAPVMQPFV